MSSKRSLILIVFVTALIGIPSPCFSGVLEITVKDEKGTLVKDAVVYAVAKGVTASRADTTGKVVIDQIDKEFVPLVMAVEVGSAVYFPNHDQLRHHVYSFSQTKKFEIPLYMGTPANPVVFDKPGVVVLGCNIHDWMSAYVFVSETRFYSITGADGKVKIDNLPSGEYDVYVWHPGMKTVSQSTRQSVAVRGEGGGEVMFLINRVNVWRAWRAPTASRGGYR